MTKQTPTPGTIMHRWEQAGLGRAPFRVTGFGQEVFQAIPGAPDCPLQPGTCCDVCGQGIMNVAYIQDADGKAIKVGFDCVLKAGDAGLRKVVDRARADHSNKLRHAREAVKVEAARALLDGDQAIRAFLSSMPSSRDWLAAKGETRLDDFMHSWNMSGATGRIALGKTLAGMQAAVAIAKAGGLA